MRARRGVLGLAVVLVLALPALAQRLSLSLSAGVFSPRQEMVREIYGTAMPVSFDAWLGFKSGFGLSAGLTLLRDDGAAVADQGDGQAFPLRFERVTVPLLVFFSPRLEGVVLRFGAGLATHSYKERWRTVDLGFEGTKLGTLLRAAVEVPVFGRLSLFGSLSYDSIATGVRSPLGDRVELGGVQFLGGVALRVR